MTTTMPGIDGAAWQRSWDRQQEGYLPDREHRFAVLLDTTTAVTPDRAPRVLDLAGGTGSISLRLRHRIPDADVTLLDLDPVLLAIAKASHGDQIRYVSADLRQPGWPDALPHQQYDAVVTATALHWLSTDRLDALYGEIRNVLRPGGVFINADHMPEEAIPALSEAFGKQDQREREALQATGGALSWSAWWELVAADPILGPLMSERGQLFGEDHSAEEFPTATWHVNALRDHGYTEAGVVWRGKRDAAVAGIR